MAATKKFLRPWRAQGQIWRGQFVEAFDEIVVGDWLHVEAMDTNAAWVRLGDRVFDVWRQRGKIMVRERPEGDR